MSKSFGLVDGKLAEADFFLEKLAESGLKFFDARCYYSAFISSARSVTFAMQSAMSGVPGFDVWYSEKQEVLKADSNANFFTRQETNRSTTAIIT